MRELWWAAIGIMGLALWQIWREGEQGYEEVPYEYEYEEPDGWWWPTTPLPSGGVEIVPPFPGGGRQWDNQVLYACNLYGMTDPLAPLAVKATIQHESGWREDARGDATPGTPAYRGDARYTGYCSIGLMQVNRCVHTGLAARYDLRDGNQNILAGCELLAAAYRLYMPDWERVFVAYNGPALAARGVATNAYKIGRAHV